MKFTSLLSLALVAAIGASSASAQQASPAVPSASAATPASMDCGKSTMKRHDHGAERNTGTTAGTMPATCAGSDAASAPNKTAKKKPAHDHAKVHKTL